MNFPEVPFDENLFASNTMLKSYWERSTNERPDANIPDWPSEETSKESADSKELRAATASQWDVELKTADEPLIEAKSDFALPQINIEKKKILDLVKPKEMTGTQIALIIVAACVPLVLFLAYTYFMAKRQNVKRV